MDSMKNGARKSSVRKTKKEVDLRDLLLLKLRSLYDIEHELVRALPKMASHASDQSLKGSFRNHLAETRAQVERLKQVFKKLGEKPTKIKVLAIRGLIKDAEWVMKHIPNPEPLDAALIAAGSYVEHYEIAGYTSAIMWAEELGLDPIANLLSESLREEIAASGKLNGLAVSKIDKKVLPSRELTDAER
mgnify:CR=1 FL=1